MSSMIEKHISDGDRSVGPFTLYWRDGRKSIVHGTDAADAMNRAGFGRGALPALDFWAAGLDTEYRWDAERKDWTRGEGNR